MKNNDYETKYIKVLDGIRALSIMMIIWFHFWQQSWIMPHIGNFDLNFLPRYGFLLVDMMILLSSFCLFLPYARSKIYQEEIPNTKEFYFNRFARIYPSYIISMIIAIIFIVLSSKTINLNFFIKDTITHLLFTHNFFQDILQNTNYFGVLWTLGVEVQFYLLFPYLAKKFIKRPLVTYFIMIIIGLISTLLISLNVTEKNISLLVNHTLTFIPVYANGILAAWLYVKYTKNKNRFMKKDLFFTSISILCIILYGYICYSVGTPNMFILQKSQIDYRFILSIIFTIFIISTIMSYKKYRLIFENKIMKFIALISFNLYIYHQVIAVKLKEFRIPYWEGNTPPNMLGDTKWQWEYLILCIVISIIVAIIMTYLVERPIAKYLKNKYKKNLNK